MLHSAVKNVNKQTKMCPSTIEMVDAGYRVLNSKIGIHPNFREKNLNSYIR